MPLRRARPSLLVMAAFFSSVAGQAAEPTPFAVISPAMAERLSQAPASPARTATIASAEHALARAPHPLPVVHTEGTLPHQGIYDASLEAMRDMPEMRDLALAARLTGDRRYADAAAGFIAAWASQYRPSYNPIDETGFDALFIAWDLLPLPQRVATESTMAALLHGFCEGGLAHPLRGRTTSINNWNSHRIKLIALSCFALGDSGAIAAAREAYRAQLAANIDDDGTTLDFRLRDAIHYVAYDLEPLTMTALAARNHGQDWARLADGRLGRAVAWLVPYADGSLTHEEFAHTTVPFDLTRRAAGVPGFAGLFEARYAGLTMALAARLNPVYAPLSRRLGAPAWLNVLLPLP